MTAPVDLFANALRDIGKMGAAESMPSAEDTALILSHYNRLVMRWAAQGWMSYYERTAAFTFTVSQQSYSIGPTASGADFIFAGGVRPPTISRAKLVMTASNPDTELELPVIFKDTYESFTIPAQSGTQPYCIYYQPTFPTGTIWPVPYPTVTSNQLRLFWPAQLGVLASTDLVTDIPMPPALEDALTATLSERICIPFGVPIPDDLRIMAAGARQVYRQLNDADPPLIPTALRGGNTVDTQWFISRGH